MANCLFREEPGGGETQLLDLGEGKRHTVPMAAFGYRTLCCRKRHHRDSGWLERQRPGIKVTCAGDRSPCAPRTHHLLLN